MPIVSYRVEAALDPAGWVGDYCSQFTPTFRQQPPIRSEVYDTFTLTCPQHTVSGCGKREAQISRSIVIPGKAAPVIGTTLWTAGLVPADSRQ